MVGVNLVKAQTELAVYDEALPIMAETQRGLVKRQAGIVNNVEWLKTRSLQSGELHHMAAQRIVALEREVFMLQEKVRGLETPWGPPIIVKRGKTE